MNIFSIDLEASVRILDYCEAEEFPYIEIDNVQSNDSRITFSALIEVKQSAPAKGKSIDVILVHIIQPGVPSAGGKGLEQQLARLQLGKISLGESESQAFRPDLTLIRDRWPIKQQIRWNFKDAPIQKPGIYALVLSVSEEGTQTDPTFLDCAYLEVK